MLSTTCCNAVVIELNLLSLCYLYRFRDKIVTGSFDKTAKVWCSRTGHCLMTMWGHDAEVVVTKFSPTQCKLATGSIDATSKIFHIETGIENIAVLSYIINTRRYDIWFVIDSTRPTTIESLFLDANNAEAINVLLLIVFNYYWLMLSQ